MDIDYNKEIAMAIMLSVLDDWDDHSKKVGLAVIANRYIDPKNNNLKDN